MIDSILNIFGTIIHYTSSIHVLVKSHLKFKEMMTDKDHHIGKMLYYIKWHTNWDKIVPGIHIEKGNACASFPLIAIFLELKKAPAINKAKAITALTEDHILDELTNLPSGCKGVSFFIKTLFSWEPEYKLSIIHRLFQYNNMIDIINHADSERIRVLAKSFHPLNAINIIPDKHQEKYIINLLDIINRSLLNKNEPNCSKICASLKSVLETIPFAIKPLNIQGNEVLSKKVYEFIFNVKQGIEQSYENGNIDGIYISFVKNICTSPENSLDGMINLCLLLENIQPYSSQELIIDLFKSFYVFIYRSRKKGGYLSEPNSQKIAGCTAIFINRLFEIKEGKYKWTDFLFDPIDDLIKGLINHEQYNLLSESGYRIYDGLSRLQGILRHKSTYRKRPRLHLKIDASINNGSEIKGTLLDISESGFCFSTDNSINKPDEMKKIISKGADLNFKLKQGYTFCIEKSITRTFPFKKRRVEKDIDENEITYWGLTFDKSIPTPIDLQNIYASTKAIVC